MKVGAFTFVLHSHMPFYRGAGKWPHGEENLHEVMAETYVPLLEALTDLHEAGVAARITLGITPVLAEQLADPQIIANFEKYVEGEIKAATEDVERFEKSKEQHFLYLAQYYLEFYSHVLSTFQQRFGRDIIGGFRRLQDAGIVEILTSAATHPYLPLMSRDSTIYAQLEIGKRTTERHFGKSAAAIWLPECAYRPGYYATATDGSSYERPGIESWLDDANLELFFSESATVEASALIGRARTEVREVVREVTRVREVAPAMYDQVAQVIEELGFESAGFVTERRIVPFENGESGSGTMEPYLVRDSNVAVLGRNRVVGEQVWSARFGYPGDGDYREFHRKDEVHGFQYWRVTDSQIDLGYKQPYDPFNAARRVQAHADHYVALVESELRRYAEENGRAGVIASSYDTELFGHWWFEGIQWLKEVLIRLSHSPAIELATASQSVTLCPPEKVIDLPESSWGHEGTHVTWINPETSWMWEAVHSAERRMEDLVQRYPDAQSGQEQALNQAARELMLLQASDWEFLYTTGQARQYAGDRFAEHVNRFNALADAINEGGDAAPNLARKYAERDNLFPDIDYRLFARRQPA